MGHQIVVDCEAYGGCPATGRLTWLGAVDLERRMGDVQRPPRPVARVAHPPGRAVRPRVVLCVDVDGVLADFVAGVCRYLRAFDPSVPLLRSADALGDDYDAWAPPHHLGALWRARRGDLGGFWSSLDPIPDAAELRRLREARADKYYVTARSGASPKAETEAWLRRVVGEPCPTVVVVDRSEAKRDVAAAVGATHVIDDRAEALEAYVAQADDFQVFGRRWLYNTGLTRPTIRWVRSLAEFLDGAGVP